MRPSGKKPRKEQVVVSFGREVKLNGIKVNKITGEIEFFNGTKKVIPKRADYSISFSREKGDKITSSASLDASQQVLIKSNSDTLHYDLLVAVDTNTKIIRNELISITSYQPCKVKQIGNDHILLAILKSCCFEFRNLKVNPEQFGWMFLIEAIMRGQKGKPQNFGLIVDAHLDRHESYNSRESAILEDFFLPQNFQLIYASSDKSNDKIYNQLISLCDKSASSIIRMIENNVEGKANLKTVKNQPYTHFRKWIQN